MKERRLQDDLAQLKRDEELQELEKKVQKNADLYRDLFLEALDGIIFWNNEEGIIEANESACRIFESSEQQLKNKKLEDFVCLSQKKYSKVLNELKQKGSVRDSLVFLMPNGQKKILEFTTKLHSVDGHHMTILRNVTDSYKMEQELRKREAKFRSIFECSIEGIILWNNQFEIVDVNPAVEELLNETKHALIGQSILSILARNKMTREHIKEQIQLHKYTEQSSGILSLTLRNGENLDVEYSTRRNVFSKLNLTTFRDITAKLKMEEQLRKSDTLSVIGQLAAGIAHEIRNPLTALKGFIQLLEDMIKEDHSMYFSVIKSELNRIDSIINEFLILAKPKVVQYIDSDIVNIMKDTIELLKPQAVLHNVQFKFEVEDEIPTIVCEPNQLKKVFINLIKNAIEVMPNGGFITINLRLLEGKEILISIQDEGEGIPPEKLQMLGEPFYTTKEKGTGLGLMVSYQIIDEHNGQIEIESVQGKGTTFLIRLPTRKDDRQNEGIHKHPNDYR
ncbi:PAS domain-containing sensor histidine kinase [Robertmurraya andreesenii]|uniref:histidine kinase n=1 Tax=Anoxybacillus andreesenii TaxID=1325932 RepID=A0ABT9UZG4_9BACL|nr:PAS domain-containing sensor histidine kinase [Robertmurraya andreesenii]MDQ0154089.1 two-component system, sporulation sensor kinase E [Robertmurraya andreesenii]